MGWAWGGVILGVVIVALAVGIPYFLTHKRMREPRDVAGSRYYLRARRQWRFQRRRASQDQRPGAPGPLPARQSAEPTSAQPDSRTSDAAKTAP
jgi:hypothetical protein